MTINLDYFTAKKEFEDHITQHQCKPGQCKLRKALWLKHMHIAGLLGTEPDDEQRQRDEFFSRYPDSPRT